MTYGEINIRWYTANRSHRVVLPSNGEYRDRIVNDMYVLMFKISEASNRWISHVFWILNATTRKPHARGHQCGRVSQRPFRIHNCIVLWAKKYICFSYKLKTNKLKPKNSEGELHSVISYWTFCQDLVRRYMQIFVTRNVYVPTILNSLYTHGRSAKTKRKDEFSGEYVRVHWHLYKSSIVVSKRTSSAMLLTFSSPNGR